MTKTTQKTARERIGHSLYMLAAGADESVLMPTLRAFLLQHIQTTEQALELLRELAAVNPPAFAESLQILATEQDKRRGTIERLAAEVHRKLEKLLPNEKPASARRAAKARKKKRARARAPAHGNLIARS
jgi:DNA-binding protein H-NS